MRRAIAYSTSRTFTANSIPSPILIDGWRDDLRWAHLVGDVYDRGPAPDKIIDLLMAYPDADIQWGNHDVVWMGAALGQPGCIAHVDA